MISQISTRLVEFEDSFDERYNRKHPRLFGDLFVSRVEVSELGELIGHSLERKWYSVLQRCPLSVSLFLVWAAVYHYKEGNLWEPIFSEMKLEQNSKDCTRLGELLLETINSYGLQAPPEGKGKKYMTPILMHGYISEHYAPQLLGYLNAVYGSYLEYDLSDESLSNLWADLFNFDQEQIKLKDGAEQFRQQEFALEREIEALEIPTTLDKDSRLKIESFGRDIGKYENLVNNYVKKLEILEAKLTTLREASALFEESAISLANPLNAADSETEALITTIIHGFGSQIQKFTIEVKEVRGEFKASENALTVTRAKRAALLKEMVKLGAGNLEEGYLRLDEYIDLLERLDNVRAKRIKREKLLDHEDELGNSTMRQVLTTSLTSLGEVNPIAFQEFIKSTLFLLESHARDGVVANDHRLSGALKHLDTMARPKAKQRGGKLSVLPKRGLGTKVRQRRLKWTTLRSPELLYDGQMRQLILQIPAQDIPAPRDSIEVPKYSLNYSNKEKPIRCSHQLQNRRLQIGKTEIALTDSSFTGVTFSWYNLHESWDLTLEPIMVFDENGRPQNGRRLLNGFYYILAKSDWQTTSSQIISGDSCQLYGYRVYEFNGRENKLVFFNQEEREITYFFSQYSGISLENINYYPGLKQDGLPVARGTPILIANKKSMSKLGEDVTFHLIYNGGLLYAESFSALVEQGLARMTEVNYEIDLVEFFPQKSVSKWQNCKIQILNSNEDVFFQTEFILVRAFELELEDKYLKVKVPSRSRLRCSVGENRDGRFWILYGQSSEISFEVFYNKIGWKKFSVNIPNGNWRLIGKDGEHLSVPLSLLQFETGVLREITLEVDAGPSLKKVIVSDINEDLVMTFNLVQGSLQIPLEHYADLFAADVEEHLEIRFEGELGQTTPECIAVIYPEIEVKDVELFYSEQEEEYLLELSFSTNYYDLSRLRFRVSTEDDGQPLFERSLRFTTDYFFLKKKNLSDLNLKVQIFYVEDIVSVFGNQQQETICWEKSITLPNVKAIYKRLQEEGLALTGFYYKGAHYTLPDCHRITNIRITPKNFEGEELLRGDFVGPRVEEEVSFYIEDNRVIAFLWDEDNDGVQYEPETGRMFWETTSNTNVMAPLENLEFIFLGGEKYES
ncbi:MAG: hypothetical protein GX331_02805 [Firmicutes bacterium]|nr:hypothetical protein [Bacillota bacterium]